MSAPWPYDDDPSPQKVPAPSWTCPENRCNCAPIREGAEKFTFSILLRDHDGELMPGARCRVLVNDEAVNDDHPYADGGGRIRVEMKHRPVTARVEWAPHDTPKKPFYPYRRIYYIDLCKDVRVEAARRRLHNLGYSHYFTLLENIKDYQRNNGYRHASGILEHIEDELTAYHDEGTVPVEQPPEPGMDAAGNGADA